MSIQRRFGGAVAAVAFLIAGTAGAAPEDYRFEPVQPRVGAGKATVAVRLVDARGGAPVPDAVLLPGKAEMAMPGMAPMTVPITPVPGGGGNGVYRLDADLAMPGAWKLDLAAKVQGEPATVHGTVRVDAVR